MQFEQLVYFVKVVETGSISGAAENLYITRQTLSNSITLLEEQLGYHLIVRKKTGIELTREGKMFYPKAKELIQSFDMLEDEMIEVGNAFNHPLRIGFYQYVDNQVFLIFKAWEQYHPEIQIQYFFIDDPESIEMLEKNEIDIVFTTVYYYNNPYFATFEICSLPLMFAVHVNHPLASNQVIKFDDLKRENILASQLRHKSFQYNGEKWMPNDTVNMHYVYYNHPFHQLSSLADNQGIAFCHKNSLYSKLKDIVLIPYEDSRYSWPYFLRVNTQLINNHHYDNLIYDLEHYLKKQLVSIFNK